MIRRELKEIELCFFSISDVVRSTIGMKFACIDAFRDGSVHMFYSL